MIDYRENMDAELKFRLERQRIQDAWEKSQWDKTERRVMTLLYASAFILMLIVLAGVVNALREPRAASSSDPGDLTIIVQPSAPSPTPEIAEPTLFGSVPDSLEARMLPRTEPRVLRTVQTPPPQPRPVKAGPISDIMEAPEPGPWMNMTLTAYGHGCRCDRLETLPGGRKRCHQFPGPPRVAKNGRFPVDGVTVAVPKSIPFGTLLEIRHNNRSFYRVATDHGSDIGPGRMDLFFASCDDADDWGRKEDIQVRVRREPLGGMR